MSTLDRWAVIAAAGQYRAFFAQIFEAVSGDPPQVNPVAQYLCKLSPSRAQLATVYASFHAFDGSAYYNSEWTAEDGHSITDANTGQVIVSGPGGSGPLADVPFEPGVATDAWLLTNINARNLAVTCQNLRPDVSAWGDGAIAQVGCGGSGAYSALNYVLYNSGLTLQTYWNKRAEQVNNTFTLATDVCGAGNTWIYANNNADPKGSLMCERGVEQTGAAFAQIEWTEDDWRIGAFVRTNGDIATLWALWTQASSLPRTP